MTDLRKAAEMALYALLDARQVMDITYKDKHAYADEIAALRQALLQDKQDSETYGYAKRLAEAIWEKHYKEESPHWRPSDNTLSVLTQIDNMTCGLEKAQPEQKPNWWNDKEYVKNRFGAAAKVVDVRRGLPAGSFKPTSEPVKERISEPVENLKPVAYLYHDTACAELANPLADSTLLVLAYDRKPNGRNETPLYTAPPKREWVGLTDEDWHNLPTSNKQGCERDAEIFDWIEDKLKEKNK